MTEYDVTFEVPDDADSDAAGETVTVRVPDDEYVLSAARADGLWLPATCRQGWCTTCAARLLEGDVDQSDARRYYDVDREAGFVLLCTARPRSDLRVATHREAAIRNHRAAHDLPP